MSSIDTVELIGLLMTAFVTGFFVSAQFLTFKKIAEVSS